MTPDPINVPSDPSFSFPSESEMAGLPDGHYRAQIASAELKTSTAGNIMWSLKLEVIEPSQYLGKFVRDNIVFSPAAAGMAFAKLKALGLGVQPGQPFNPHASLNQIIGKKVAITTRAEEFNGMISPKVQRMAADPGPGGLPAAPKTAARPTAVNSSAAAASGTQPSKATPMTPTNPAEKPSSEEALPF